jgi:putative oxidoreductase
LLDRLIPNFGPRVSVAMLILRIVVGASFILHGAPKMAHPMSWDGPTGPLPGVPGWMQLIICIAENAGGWCIILGFLTPLFAFIQACDMVVVVFIVKMGHGLPYIGKGPNYEIEAHLLAGALVLLLCGPGMYSLDAALKSLMKRRRSAGAVSS